MPGHLLFFNLFPERNHQPVQCLVLLTSRHPDHQPGLSSSLHLLGLCFSKVRQPRRLEVHHVLRLRQLHHRYFGRLRLRAHHRLHKLPVVFVSKWHCLHLPAHLRNFLRRPAVLHRLPCRKPAGGLCRKPRLHYFLCRQHLCLEWLNQPVQRNLRATIRNPDHELGELWSIYLLGLCCSQLRQQG